MYCGNCGNQINDNAKYCGKCGYQIVANNRIFNESREQLHNEENNQPNSISVGEFINDIRLQMNPDVLVKKVVFCVLVICIFCLSKGTLIDFDFFKGSYSKIVDIINSIAAFTEEASPAMLKWGEWFLVIGQVLLFIALAVIFFKSDIAHKLTVVGGILNIASMVILMLYCLRMFEMEGYHEGLSIFTAVPWLFLIINFIIMILTSPSNMYESKLIQTYAGKSYNHLSGLYKERTSMWRCEECGKWNNSSVIYCSCGTKRKYY